MDRRREDQMAFSRKDHILRELKANHDKMKGLLLPAMVRAEALHKKHTLLKSEQGDDEDDVLILPVEGQQLITSAVEAKLTTVWDDTMRRLAGEKWYDPNEEEQALMVHSGGKSLDPEDSTEQPSRVKTTIIVQLNKELEMLKEMNDKNAKQANEYKEKYYGANREVKKLTKEASKWFNFQEEVRRLEAERDSTVNKLHNDLATALKKRAAYAKRKDCPKEDVRANEKTIDLTGRMIEEAKQEPAGHLENVTNFLAARVMQASLSKKVTTQTEELSQLRAELEKLKKQSRLRELRGILGETLVCLKLDRTFLQDAFLAAIPAADHSLAAPSQSAPHAGTNPADESIAAHSVHLIPADDNPAPPGDNPVAAHSTAPHLSSHHGAVAATAAHSTLSASEPLRPRPQPPAADDDAIIMAFLRSSKFAAPW
ncbi:hypothetical protein L7F22_023826, partial [Adiantum nelumboides]|nr:hypothetical protein [Adiantum nelumboides]